jgi:hypothetical protein
MTLFTVVCYDFAIFSRSKSRILEKSTLSPCGYFMEIPARKNKFVFFVPPFLRSPKLCEVKTEFFRFSRERTFFHRQNPDCREF